MLSFLIKLSENDKRILLFVLFLVVILLVLLGIIYDGIRLLIRTQGQEINRMMTPAYKSGAIANKKHFKQIARRKSHVYFYRKYRFTFLFGLLAFIIYGTVSLFYKHWLNIFDYELEGFTTLFYILDMENAPRANFFGIEIINQFPEAISRPHFSALAIPSYILAPIFVYVFVSALILSLGLFSRTIAINKIARGLFTHTLEKGSLIDFEAYGAEVAKEGINKPDTKATPSEDNKT